MTEKQNLKVHEFESQIFSDLRISLDFQSFHNCKFISCQMVYRGYGPVSLIGNSFSSCEWIFEDAASATLGFLSALHQQGKGGEVLVESILARAIGRKF